MRVLSKSVLVAVALIQPLWAQSSSEASAGEIATSARTESSLVPASDSPSVGVGSHLIWRVTVNDTERDGAELTEPDVAAQLGPAWAVVDGPVDQLDPSVPKAQRPDLDQAWTIMPLAGGETTTPMLSVTFSDGATAFIPTASVQVLPSLGESEDEARPLMGFRDAPDRRVGDPRTALLALGGLLALVLLAVLWRRSVRRRGAATATSAPEATPVELIQALEASDAGSGTKMAALAPLFRRALDSSLPAAERQRRAALTDLEWAGEVKSGGGSDAASLIEELAQYRYGGGEPTSFAVKDALQRTKDLIASAGQQASAASPEEAA